MEVDAAEFARAVDRVATVSSERSRAVKMSIDEDRLILSVNAPDSGAAEEELAVAYGDERWKSVSTPNTCWKSPARWIAKTPCSCSTRRRSDADARRQ